MSRLCLCMIVGVLVTGAVAFPNGAPIEACLRGMSPNHTPHVSQNIRSIPFAVYRETFDGGVRVTIQAQGDRYFKGFMIQAQKSDQRRSPAVGEQWGRWQTVQHVNQLPECSAVTHADRSQKAGVTVTWTGCENVVMRVTVLENYTTFWSNMEAVETSSPGHVVASRRQQSSSRCVAPSESPFSRRSLF